MLSIFGKICRRKNLIIHSLLLAVWQKAFRFGENTTLNPVARYTLYQSYPYFKIAHQNLLIIAKPHSQVLHKCKFDILSKAKKPQYHEDMGGYSLHSVKKEFYK